MTTSVALDHDERLQTCSGRESALDWLLAHGQYDDVIRIFHGANGKIICEAWGTLARADTAAQAIMICARANGWRE